MCKPGNRTISRECRDRIFVTNGGKGMSNQEMRHLLRINDGCMVKKKEDLVDIQRESVLIS